MYINNLYTNSQVKYEQVIFVGDIKYDTKCNKI